MKNKIKVVVSTIFYPVTMARWFINALERRDDIDLVTVGAFTNNWIPWNHGMYLPMKYVYAPTIPLPFPPQPHQDPTLIEHQISFHPDLWIQIDAGFHFSRRPEAIHSVVIATDPHVLSPQYEECRTYADIFFNMQKFYMKPTDVYLPYAYDPILHASMPEIEKKYDACLIGLQYPQRNQLVQALRQIGLNVYYENGEAYEEYRWRYNESRVALNWSTLEDLNARTFEAMGMKIPLVTNRVPDLKEFFLDGRDFLGFGSIPEAVEKVQWALQYPDCVKAIAESAYAVVSSGHTYDDRVQTILEKCELVCKS